MGRRLRRGREFTEHEQLCAVEVIVINETMAASFRPGEGPLGKRIQIYDLQPMPWREIVEVVNESKEVGLGRATRLEIYGALLATSRSPQGRYGVILGATVSG
jgi:hypothetical protein